MIFGCRLGFQFMLVVTATSYCQGERRQRMAIPRERNGIVRLQHGALQCMGALLTSRIVLTCCTCVSDVFFRCNDDDQVTYEVRALNPENVTVKSEDERKVSARDVFIHPQCDIDGTYDYGLITLEHGISGKGGGGDCFMALSKSVSSRSQAPSTGICVLHTILEDSADGEILEIYTQFVDWRNCWNGSETKSAFQAKYCLRPLDPQVSLEDGQCGSPIFCDRKLVGILARRYAIAGGIFASVNGLDGALEFIRETVKLDIREDSGEEEGYLDRKKMLRRNRKRRGHQDKRERDE